MCLAVPAKVETIHGRTATVALDGSRTNVVMALVPEAKVGDWVLVHAGMAITVLEEKDALQTYELLRQMDEIGEGGKSRMDAT